jgi:RES domain-containing protein
MGLDASVALVEIKATAYRYSSYDTPLWASENSRAGRWHRRGDGPTQYLSMSADGAWAELIRYEELETEYEVAMVSVSMWAAAITQGRVANYSTFDLAEAAGLDPAALVNDDFEICQQEGARLRSLGLSGVIAPSAALPGAVNLTLFGPRFASRWGRRPLVDSAIPATIIAKGAPPPGLLGEVRRLGETHSGIAAHILAHASTSGESAVE